MDIRQLADQFSGVKWQGDRFMAQCPAHEDRKPSLSAATGDDGRVLLKCHAGCQTEDVLLAMHLTYADLHSISTTPTLRSSPSTPTTYDYCDVDGTLLSQSVRRADKSFSVRTPDGNGGWVYKASTTRVPYRLPDLVDQSTIWIVEGEKDVDRCRKVGLSATCNMSGAGKWKSSDTQALVDLKTVTQVYVVPDHDEAGFKHARMVEAEMQRVGIPVSIVPLPNLPPKGDISDWFNAGNTVEQLEALASSPTPLPDKPPDLTKSKFTLTLASEITPKPVYWLWEGRLPLGAISLLGGREGQGKSLWSYHLAAEITRGQTPGHFFGTPKSVIVVATEDSWKHTIVPRLMAAGANLDRIIQVTPPPSFPADLDELARLIEAKDVALLILDPLLSRLDPKLNTHVDAEVRRGLEPLAAWAETQEIAILGLVHVNKNTMGDVLTSFTGSRAFTAVARAALVLMADPDDPTTRLLGQVKNNLGKTEQPTHVFTIEETFVEGNINTAKLTWLPDDPRSPHDIWDQQKAAARSTSGSAPTRIDEATAWLVEYLRTHGGTADTADIVKAGERLGYARWLLNDAKKKLRLDPIYRGEWTLPEAALVGTPHAPTNPTNPTSLAGAPPPNSGAVHTEGRQEEVPPPHGTL